MNDDYIHDPGNALYEQYHFSQAVRCNGLLLCSGQLGTDGNGQIPDEFAAEARNAWQAVGTVLASAGLGYGDIVEYTTYHVGLQQTLPAFMTARDACLGEPWPAWTAIGISELAVPGARLEVRVTARLPD